MNIIKVGKNEKYKTINEAICDITQPTYIYLMDEIYREKVVIDKDNIIIDGCSKAKIIYGDYAEKIHDDGREYVTFRTYTVLVKGKHVTLKNLEIINDAGEGKGIGQAVALHLYNDDIKVISCKLKAKQDTLFCGPFSPDLVERYIPLLPEDERIHNGEFHQLFIDTYIEGTVDFIFGGASCDFINCDIVSLNSNRTTWICAPDHDKENEYGMNFISCHLIKGEGVKKGSVYLARPWREYGKCHFIDCVMDDHINEEGFSIWEGTTRHLNARFYESNSKGEGANKNKRVPWSHVE